jgi:uncharacterized protein involved in response to NO
MNALNRFFGEGFRVFFWAAGIWALFSVSFWLLWLGVHWLGGTFTALPFSMPPHQWHGHELIFGYGAAALGGFFLTAVPNWTGAKAARHAFIASVAAIWLAGRLVNWFSGSLPPLAVAVIDLAFLPVLAAKIATQLWSQPKPQNVVFLGFISLVWVANLLVHLEWMGQTADTANMGLYGGLYALCAMIAVVGGRVTPAFTRNAMLRDGLEQHLPVSRKYFELPAVFLFAVIPVGHMAGVPEQIMAVLFAAAGALQILRVLGWQPRFALSQPIIWTLHLSLTLIGLGYIMTALATLGFGSAVGALHVTAIGGVAGMTLAVMSRATLGHSGRPLQAPANLVLAYALVPGAAVLRWLAAEAPSNWYFPLIMAAGALWLLAFALYVFGLWPAFFGPRAGKEA